MAGNGTVKVYRDSGVAEDYALRSIRYELRPDGVALCMWNEPKSLNSLSPNLVQETFVVLEHMKRDDAVRAAVWTGAGRAWGSGAQLRGDKTVHLPKDVKAEYLARGLSWKEGQGPAFWVLLTIAFWDFPKASVAAVNGLGVGGGANLALANCHDLVLLSEEARFKYPFADMGITPEIGSSLLLPFIAGFAKAKEVLLVGEWFSAAEALQMGLANRVLPAPKLLPEALKLAGVLAAKPSMAAIRIGKQVINHQLRQHLNATLEMEQRVMAEAQKEMMKAMQAKAKARGGKKSSKL